MMGANELMIIHNGMKEHLGFFLMILLVVEGVSLMVHSIIEKKRERSIAVVKRELGH